MIVSEEVKKDVTKLSDKNTEKPLTSAEEYVKIEFPIEKEESSVRYCPVGPNRFRINFYKKNITAYKRHCSRCGYEGTGHFPTNPKEKDPDKMRMSCPHCGRVVHYI